LARAKGAIFPALPSDVSGGQSLHTTFSFLFMKASGDQLRQIALLIEAGAVRPVLDRVFPFQATNEALAYVETGRAKGKVVIKVN
jgi:alcohol dehydrogenase